MTRIGFIGTGNCAIQHAKVLRVLGANIVSCFGTNTEKTTQFSSTFQCKPYLDHHSMLSNDNLDAIYIAIPPYAHDGVVELAAIEKNIHIFCEKPVGLDLSVCELVSSKLDNTTLITCAGYQLRYEPLMDEIKAIIQRNDISTVRVCSYSYMPQVDWWKRTDLSGGMMVEQGTHYIDLLRYLFGNIAAVSAVKSSGHSSREYPGSDLYDSMEAICKFESGIIGSIGITHLLNTISARQDYLEVYGLNFALKIDLHKLRYKNEAAATYKEKNDKEWRTISNSTSKEDLFTKQSSAFISAIHSGNAEQIKCTYADAVETLKVTLAMNLSAETNIFTKA